MWARQHICTGSAAELESAQHSTDPSQSVWFVFGGGGSGIEWNVQKNFLLLLKKDYLKHFIEPEHSYNKDYKFLFMDLFNLF